MVVFLPWFIFFVFSLNLIECSLAPIPGLVFNASLTQPLVPQPCFKNFGIKDHFQIMMGFIIDCSTRRRRHWGGRRGGSSVPPQRQMIQKILGKKRHGVRCVCKNSKFVLGQHRVLFLPFLLFLFSHQRVQMIDMVQCWRVHVQRATKQFDHVLLHNGPQFRFVGAHIIQHGGG